jgi:hypothetical protein
MDMSRNQLFADAADIIIPGSNQTQEISIASMFFASSKLKRKKKDAVLTK